MSEAEGRSQGGDGMSYASDEDIRQRNEEEERKGMPKPCPFCGWLPRKRRKVFCANLSLPCPIAFKRMTEEEWNQRA